MNDSQKLVLEFHRKFRLATGEKPAFRDETLRLSLIDEEKRELESAVEAGDMVLAIDALCDLLYVTYGAAVTWGIDLEPFFREVHRTNMRKEVGVIREDGKILKPADWTPPRIGAILENLLHHPIPLPRHDALVSDEP